MFKKPVTDDACVLFQCSPAGDGNDPRWAPEAFGLFAQEAAVRTGTRILAVEGSRNDDERGFYLPPLRLGSLADFVDAANERPVLRRLQDTLVEVGRRGINPLARGDFLNLPRGRKNPALQQRRRQLCVHHAPLRRLPMSNPTISPTTRQMPPAQYAVRLAMASRRLSNRLSEACRLATSHLSPSLTSVALQRAGRSSILPSCNLKCSVALPKEITVLPP